MPPFGGNGDTFDFSSSKFFYRYDAMFFLHSEGSGRNWILQRENGSVDSSELVIGRQRCHIRWLLGTIRAQRALVLSRGQEFPSAQNSSLDHANPGFRKPRNSRISKPWDTAQYLLNSLYCFGWYQYIINFVGFSWYNLCSLLTEH